MHAKAGRRRWPLVFAAGCLVMATVSWLGCARPSRERPVPDPASRRMTPHGEVVGFQGLYNSHAWLGIPFAKPPVGRLRWRAPEAPDTWAATREALAFGPPCTQFASRFGGVTDVKPGQPAGSEDCLYLNIWAPRFAAGQVPSGDRRLPVMLWIHGGGNTIGEAGFYNGGNLAATHNLVVVTTNYRLGPFGWLRHAALRGDDANAHDRSGNFGTLDLIRALAWVQENIGAFGGDPGNVTIFGESAGGANVYSLLLSPPAKGMFHRAIVQSGGLWMPGPEEAENFADATPPGDANSSSEMLLRLLIADGSAADRGAAKARLAGMPAAEIARYLRAKSNREILSAYTPLPNNGMIDMPKLIRDGVVLPREDPLERLGRAGGHNQVPVIIGTNRDENKLFMFADPSRVRLVLWLFPRLRDPRTYNLHAEYLSKMWKATGADEPAAAIHTSGGPPVFVYRFDWDEEPTVAGADLAEMLGAAHAFEIPFVFGHFDLGREGNMIFSRENEAGRMALAARMMSYWAEFAYRGAPGGGRDGDLPDWQPWGDAGAANPGFLVFDTGLLKMSTDVVTRAGVLAAVDDDPRLPTQRDKCAVFRELARWSSRGLPQHEYPTAGRQGCAQYPFDAYPWQD